MLKCLQNVLYCGYILIHHRFKGPIHELHVKCEITCHKKPSEFISVEWWNIVKYNFYNLLVGHSCIL